MAKSSSSTGRHTRHNSSQSASILDRVAARRATLGRTLGAIVGDMALLSPAERAQLSMLDSTPPRKRPAKTRR